MAKATHTGTCQACGRTHKVNPERGTLSQHGYTVDFGYFNGACHGSHRTPFEESCDMLPGMIDTALHMISQHEDRINELEVMKETNTAVVTRRSHRKNRTIEVKLYSVEKTKKTFYGDSEYTSDCTVYDFDGRQAEVNGHGNQTPTEMCEMLNTYAQEAEQRCINRMNEYITWQETRLENWKPGTLKAI